jgi:hypothetical protein|tara:strand:+ start:1402 stop:1524 length:123 start_codon:yes stop_codon:yes gene_type:complete
MGTLLSLNDAYANELANSYAINADFRRNAKVALFLRLVEG